MKGNRGLLVLLLSGLCVSSGIHAKKDLFAKTRRKFEELIKKPTPQPGYCKEAQTLYNRLVKEGLATAEDQKRLAQMGQKCDKVAAKRAEVRKKAAEDVKKAKAAAKNREKEVKVVKEVAKQVKTILRSKSGDEFTETEMRELQKIIDELNKSVDKHAAAGAELDAMLAMITASVDKPDPSAIEAEAIDEKAKKSDEEALKILDELIALEQAKKAEREAEDLPWNVSTVYSAAAKLERATAVPATALKRAVHKDVRPTPAVAERVKAPEPARAVLRGAPEVPPAPEAEKAKKAAAQEPELREAIKEAMMKRRRGIAPEDE